MKMNLKWSAVFVASTVLAQGNLPIIDTPSTLVQCQPTLLTFNGGTAPYYISAIPGGQASGTPLATFPTQTGNSYTWLVDVAAGTSVTVQIRDSTGQLNYSQQVTVLAGDSTTCTSTPSNPLNNSPPPSSSSSMSMVSVASSTSGSDKTPSESGKASETEKTRSTSSSSSSTTSRSNGAATTSNSPKTSSSTSFKLNNYDSVFVTFVTTCVVLILAA